MNIFLIIPNSSEFEDVHSAIQQAVSKVDVKINRADDLKGLASISGKIENAIRSADLVIADVSAANANVMFELGYAKSSVKPIITICRKDDTIPFDIAQTRVLMYDRLRLQETLIKPLRNAITHRKIEEFISPEIESATKIKDDLNTVFVSYSHEDTLFLNRLKVHMRPFEKKGLIDLWVDTKIKVGEKWRDKINEALDRSAIAILLISADFLASDFHNSVVGVDTNHLQKYYLELFFL